MNPNQPLGAEGKEPGMQQELIDRLSIITEEERQILAGTGEINRSIFTAPDSFIVDADKLMGRGELVAARHHARFAPYPNHSHNYVEMIYMCSGATTHLINSAETLVLQTGDLLFLNQAVYHEILPAAQEDVAVNFIILPQFFDRSFTMLERENVLRDFLISTLSGESTFSGYLHIQAHDILPVQNLIENMIWTLLEKKQGVNLLNQTSMGLLLWNLTLFAESINRADPHRQDENLVFTVLKYIETNYRDGTLEEISDRLRQPPYAVSRLLKKHTGQNFKELLQQRKLQQAAYLLTNTALAADAILESIGYENSSYFYRKFREKYGCSPAEYRRAQP